MDELKTKISRVLVSLNKNPKNKWAVKEITEVFNRMMNYVTELELDNFNLSVGVRDAMNDAEQFARVNDKLARFLKECRKVNTVEENERQLKERYELAK